VATERGGVHDEHHGHGLPQLGEFGGSGGAEGFAKEAVEGGDDGREPEHHKRRHEDPEARRGVGGLGRGLPWCTHGRRVEACMLYPRRMSLDRPKPSARTWPFIVLCIAVIVALVVALLVKSCPPTPAPAGKPAPVEVPDVKAAPAALPEPAKDAPK